VIGALSVTIATATAGATIYYTLDGSTPSAASAQYTAAIALNVTGLYIIKAYAVAAGLADSAVASAVYAVYVPVSGGGQPTASSGVAVTNPVGGIGIAVLVSNGGVVQLDITQDGSPLPGGDTAQTTITNSSGSVAVTLVGPEPIYQFTAPGVYVATAAVTNANGTPAGTAEITLPISLAEAGGASGTTPPSSLSIASVTLNGKLLLNLGKKDTLAFKGTIELPAGLDLSKPQTLSVGLGNVMDTAKLSIKGQAKAGAARLLKNVTVKYPKLPTGTTLTPAGKNATVSFTLTGLDLSSQGFDEAGISKAGGTAGQSVKRTIQAALVLGGTAYSVPIPVDWKLAKNGSSGQITTEK
jgi:hypothetical protein